MENSQALKTFVNSNQVIGKMRWLIGCASDFTNTHMNYLVTDRQKFFQINKSSQLNCWEAVFWLGCCSCSNLTVRESKFGAIKSTGCMKPDYEDVLKAQIGFDKRVNYNANEDREGDVIFFYGDAHSALSLGGGQVLSLWFGPNGNDSLQQTTIDDLVNMLRAEPRAYLKALEQWCSDEGLYYRPAQGVEGVSPETTVGDVIQMFLDGLDNTDETDSDNNNNADSDNNNNNNQQKKKTTYTAEEIDKKIFSVKEVKQAAPTLIKRVPNPFQ